MKFLKFGEGYINTKNIDNIHLRKSEVSTEEDCFYLTIHTKEIFCTEKFNTQEKRQESLDYVLKVLEIV